MDAERARYCRSVLDYCNTYAKLAKIKTNLDDGEIVSDETLLTISHLVEELEQRQKELFAYQVMMGYEASLDFLTDDVFHGFELKKGELVGDLQFAYQIACPWFCDFAYGKSDNHFLFEVAALIRALTNVDERFAIVKNAS